MEKTYEISTVCRFCLCQYDLIPISQATASLLTIEDIVHFTGIEITDEEQLSYAMCYQCCHTLENSFAFRSTCQGNDFIFKQLFSMLIESVKDGDLKEYEDKIQEENEHSGNECDILLDTEEEYPIESNTTATSEFLPTSQTMDTPTIETSTYWPDDDSEVQAITDDESITSETLSQLISEDSDGDIKKQKKRSREKELCPICGKIVCNLRSHYRNTHVMEKKFACPHCQMVMRHQANMWKHINAVHKKKNIIFCEQCGKGFRHKNSYKSHMMSHHGLGEKYECKVCSRTFNQRSCYTMHMKRWHLPPKEYACLTCNKTFKESKLLRGHQRVHSNDRPYACSLCPKRFKSLDAKKKHEITHTGVRFACELCEKSYSYKTQLSSHYRKDHEEMTHAGTKNGKIGAGSTTID